MLFKAEGIIVKTSSFGEADKIVTVYSKEFGKMNAIAKGCRKPKSSLAGRIDLFCLNNFVLAKGKNLDIISQADLINNYYDIHKSLDKLNAASYIARVINRATLPAMISSELFNLLKELFGLLAAYEDSEKIKRLFQQKFLAIEGLSTDSKIISDEEFEKILYNVA